MKNIKWISLFVLLTFFIAQSSLALAIIPFVSSTFAKKYTRLVNSEKSVSFYLKTKNRCSQIGLKGYCLYMKNGKEVITSSIENYKKGNIYSKTVDLSKYIKSGETYYVEATYYADGETVTDTSPKVKFD